MYKRDYLSQGSSEYSSTQDSSRAELMSFLKATYQLFAGSLLAATAGAYIGLDMVSTIATWYWGLVIFQFVLLFALFAVKRKPGINLAVLFGFTFVSGLTITPLLSSILNMPAGASIVAQAFFNDFSSVCRNFNVCYVNKKRLLGNGKNAFHCINYLNCWFYIKYFLSIIVVTIRYCWSWCFIILSIYSL